MKTFLYTITDALLVTYSQLVVKWRTHVGVDSETATNRLGKFIGYFSGPYIISAYIAALLSSFIWLVVIQRILLSTEFPIYIGTAFLLVMVGSAFILGEFISINRVIAAFLIFAGIILGTVN
jgi:multidrug transporter EmrE-like cation transporter